MKTKEQRLSDAWIPVTKRIPPLDKTEILIWLPEVKQVRIEQSLNIYQAAKRMAANDVGPDLDPNSVAWDKRLSHWMKIIPPC